MAFHQGLQHLLDHHPTAPSASPSCRSLQVPATGHYIHPPTPAAPIRPRPQHAISISLVPLPVDAFKRAIWLFTKACSTCSTTTTAYRKYEPHAALFRRLPTSILAFHQGQQHCSTTTTARHQHHLHVASIRRFNRASCTPRYQQHPRATSSRLWRHL